MYFKKSYRFFTQTMKNFYTLTMIWGRLDSKALFSLKYIETIHN